jgi:phosphate transport system protein
MDKMNLTKHISSQFNEEIEQVRNHVMAMGGLIEQQLADALNAIASSDAELARQVIANDLKVNDWEIKIDHECTRIIAKRQPAASDLRLIMAIVKTISDLERIGDEAERIAKVALESFNSAQQDLLVNLDNMGRHVAQMLHDGLDAFARMDVEAALAVHREDKKVDREYEAINKEIENQTLDMKLAERHIKDANEEIADKARILDAAKKNIATKEGNLKVKKGELDKIVAETEKEEKECRAVSEKARAAVDARLLTSFDRIRKNFRNGLAVVSIVRDACGGCFNAIPPQRQSEIRQHKKIIVCENCGRVLVDEEMNATK